jgi:hypothetical protein
MLLLLVMQFIMIHGGNMKMFLFGVIFGIMVATVGFSGIAKIMDNGINKTKEIAVESAK